MPFTAELGALGDLGQLSEEVAWQPCWLRGSGRAWRCDPGARNFIATDRGDEPATDEGGAAVAIEFGG